MEHISSSKPRPEHVAQVCRNGHLVLSSLKEFPQFRKSFCEECGADTVNQCQACGWPITGYGPNAWMADSGPYRPPKYCGECGKPFPWTEKALRAAKEFTDESSELTSDQKVILKEAIDNLASDTPLTPLAASRFKKIMNKIAPAGGALLQKIIEGVMTEAAKKMIGL